MRVTKFFSEIDWDDFVDRHPRGWFWHLRSWVHYQIAYSPGSIDESRVVVDDDDRLLGIAPIVRSVSGELTYGGGPHPYPLAKNKAAYDVLIETMAQKGGGCLKDHAFIPSPGSPVRSGLIESGSVVHRVIDLERLQWADVRKSYHALVNKALRKYTVTSYIGEHALVHTVPGLATPFARYQFCHARLASKPRPNATYRAQARWLEQDQALVTIAEEAGAVWGVQYWFLYKRCAYYGSSAAEIHDGVGHAMVWRTLLALRDAGYTRADMGSLGGQTEKERGIAMFKAGFGGRDVPVRTERVMP